MYMVLVLPSVAVMDQSISNISLMIANQANQSLIARFMGPAWDPPGDDRTQVGPMLAPWTLLSGMVTGNPRTEATPRYLKPVCIFNGAYAVAAMNYLESFLLKDFTPSELNMDK